MGAVAVASRRQRRFPWGLAVAVLVGGLATGAAAALIHSHTTSGPPARRAVPNAAATLDPASVTWQDYGGAAVPQAPAGPHDTQEGRAVGFDHTPAGATLAAVNLSYRAGSAAGPGVFEPTIAQQVVGPDKDQFLSIIEAQYAKDGPQTPDQIAAVRALSSTTWAYKVDAYTASAASVEVLLRSIPPDKTPTYVNLSLTVDWQGADWALVAPAHGLWSSVSRIVTEVPSGYTVLKTGGA
jgi:hypothetical protein